MRAASTEPSPRSPSDILIRGVCNDKEDKRPQHPLRASKEAMRASSPQPATWCTTRASSKQGNSDTKEATLSATIDDTRKDRPDILPHNLCPAVERWARRGGNLRMRQALDLQSPLVPTPPPLPPVPNKNEFLTFQRQFL